MNILINGSGAVGIALGTSMISQDANVSFYTSDKTADALKNGVERTGLFNHLKYNSTCFNVYTRYEDIPSNTFDYVFICSKTTANDDISKSLDINRHILKNDAKIIIFQNGFGNDRDYLRFFNDNQLYCARVITGFMRPERNISEITVYTEPIMIGSLCDADINNVKIIAEMISNSGIPCEVTDHVETYLLAKMLYNCTLNPLGAILDVTYGELTENEYSVNIMNKLIDEIFNVIDATGYKTDWNNSNEYKDVFYSKLVPDTYNHKSSTLQDIKRRQVTEIDSLNGTIIRLAHENNIEVPVNEVIYNLIKTIEAGF